MVLPVSSWLTWMGNRSPLTVSSDNRVTVNCPVWPGRRMPAGPLAAVASTRAFDR